MKNIIGKSIWIILLTGVPLNAMENTCKEAMVPNTLMELVTYIPSGADPGNQENRWGDMRPALDLHEKRPFWRPDFKDVLDEKGIKFTVTPNSNIRGMEYAAFNPTAVRTDLGNGLGIRVYLFFRGEDNYGRATGSPLGMFNPKGTSRIFLLVSNDSDGQDFKGCVPKIVLEPDLAMPTEIPGGTEDSRIVEFVTPVTDGVNTYRFAMTYTAYDGGLARLAIVFSNDLVDWGEHRLMFKDEDVLKNPIIENTAWTKSGPILNERRIVDGKSVYIMYFGEGPKILMATSKDGINWDYPTDSKAIFSTRGHEYFDSKLVEPALVFTDEDGYIHLYYNGDGPPNGYQTGEIIFALDDPTKIIYRSEAPFLGPVKSAGSTQVGHVRFLQGRTRNPNTKEVTLWWGYGDKMVGSSTGREPPESHPQGPLKR